VRAHIGLGTLALLAVGLSVVAAFVTVGPYSPPQPQTSALLASALLALTLLHDPADN
jgi:hypothetical protein